MDFFVLLSSRGVCFVVREATCWVLQIGEIVQSI